MNDTTHLAQAVNDALWSASESDRCGNAANVVDGLFAIARAILLHGKALATAGEAVAKANDLQTEILRLQGLVESLSARVAAQSDLLSQRDERKDQS